MRIEERLRAVAAMVPPESRVADIGSDHAYLAIYLFRACGAARVIAADKNEGPCKAARQMIKKAGLASEIPVRCGDGLSVLSFGEVDVVCIAGMGGALIARILAASPQVLAGLRRLVLQPMNDAPLLRRWLYEHGWHLTVEMLAQEDGRIYEIMAAEPGEEEIPAEELLVIGPCLWEEKPPLLATHIDGIVKRARRAAAGMEKSPAAQQSESYRKLRAEIEKLEAKRIW